MRHLLSEPDATVAIRYYVEGKENIILLKGHVAKTLKKAMLVRAHPIVLHFPLTEEAMGDMPIVQIILSAEGEQATIDVFVNEFAPSEVSEFDTYRVECAGIRSLIEEATRPSPGSALERILTTWRIREEAVF